MESWPVVKDLVLFLVALYGAALSTFNWRQAVRRDRRAVLVTASTAMPTYGARLGSPFAKIEAVNVGHRVVVIRTLTFELPSGDRLMPLSGDACPGMPDTRLPATLSDGQSAHFLISYSELGHALMQNGHSSKVSLVPVCVDSTDAVYKGPPWEVDPAEFVLIAE